SALGLRTSDEPPLFRSRPSGLARHGGFRLPVRRAPELSSRDPRSTGLAAPPSPLVLLSRGRRRHLDQRADRNRDPGDGDRSLRRLDSPVAAPRVVPSADRDRPLSPRHRPLASRRGAGSPRVHPLLLHPRALRSLSDPSASTLPTALVL